MSFFLACLGKDLFFHTETCKFRDQRILKIGLFHRVKELSEVNQIDIPNSQHYLYCNAKRMVHLTFLEKSSYFNRKYRLIRSLFAYSFFKNIETLLGQRVVQVRPKLVWSITSAVRVWNKNNFWYSLRCKKVSFSYGSFQLFRITCNYWILKIGLFMGSRSCPNQTKLRMENPLCT